MFQEEIKTCPFGDIWEHYCEKQGVPVNESWFAEVQKYESEVLFARK